MSINQTESQALGRKGERWFAGQLPKNWILQRPSEDIGIDGVVVVTDPGDLNGLEFRVQIKASHVWKRQNGNIILRNLKRNSVRNWQFQLTPAMLVLYEEQSDSGIYAWVWELFDRKTILELISGKTETVTLKIPTMNGINAQCWQDVKNWLLQYFESQSRAVSSANIATTLMPVLNSLAAGIYVLQASHFSARHSSPEQTTAQLSLESVTHIGVVKSLRQLLTHLAPDCLLAKELQSALHLYKTQVDTFLQDFDGMVEARGDVATWCNKEIMEKARPRLMMILADLLSRLTDCTKKSELIFYRNSRSKSVDSDMLAASQFEK